jgi:hypothetical protein
MIFYIEKHIDKSIVNKRNLLITPISNDWNNNLIYRKKTSIYPLQENNIITYKSITDKFIYYCILYTNNVYKHVIYTNNNNYNNVYKHVIYIKP